MARTALLAFSHVVGRADDAIDLGAAALLIGELEHPGLDLAPYLASLDRLAEEAAASGGSDGPMRGLLSHLFGDLGFRGNHADYYDPRNSFLSDVLERRVGIPITLSIVLMEVARRMGLTLHGVGFPGHFLVETRGVYLDAFHGGVTLSKAELEERLAQAAGPGVRLGPEHLPLVGPRAILTRVLNNLRGIYARRRDAARLHEVEERLAILRTPPAPTPGTTSRN